MFDAVVGGYDVDWRNVEGLVLNFVVERNAPSGGASVEDRAVGRARLMKAETRTRRWSDDSVRSTTSSSDLK